MTTQFEPRTYINKLTNHPWRHGWKTLLLALEDERQQEQLSRLVSE